MDKRTAVAQLRRAVQLLMNTLEDDALLMEVACVAPAYEAGRSYKVGEVLTYGLSAVDDPQLYRVVQGHVSQADWPPDGVSALYQAIGLTPAGVPIWVQPVGAHDAYILGDQVGHGGQVWESDTNGNVWEPGVYGWRLV